MTIEERINTVSEQIKSLCSGFIGRPLTPKIVQEVKDLCEPLLESLIDSSEIKVEFVESDLKQNMIRYIITIPESLLPE